MKSLRLVVCGMIIGAIGLTGFAQDSIDKAAKVDKKEWKQLFNGKNLDGWEIKIKGYDLNDNFNNTFRVENGIMKVSYDKYDKFDSKFAHMFTKEKFSHYILRAEYRFVGNQVNEGPAWATRNNGLMLHSQSAASMGKDQDFPISLEMQLLGGLGKGPRTTGNLCTPGTNVVMEGKLITKHCINSTSETYDGDQWVTAEVEVHGNGVVKHIINGKVVLTYEKPQMGGGSISGFDPAIYKEGLLIEEGHIAIQGESHPTEFRKIEILNLVGCMDKKAKNYKPYYEKDAPATCKYK